MLKLQLIHGQVGQPGGEIETVSDCGLFNSLESIIDYINEHHNNPPYIRQLGNIGLVHAVPVWIDYGSYTHFYKITESEA